MYVVAFDRDSKGLYSADLRGRVIQWDHRASREVRRFDAGLLHTYNAGQQVDYGGVRDLALSQDASRIACCGLIEALVERAREKHYAGATAANTLTGGRHEGT